MKDTEKREYTVAYFVPALDAAYAECGEHIERRYGIPSVARTYYAHATAKHTLMLTFDDRRSLVSKLSLAANGALKPISARFGIEPKTFENSGTVYIPIENAKSQFGRVIALFAEWGYPIDGYEGQTPHATIATGICARQLPAVRKTVHAFPFPFGEPVELDSLVLFEKPEGTRSRWEPVKQFMLRDTAA